LGRFATIVTENFIAYIKNSELLMKAVQATFVDKETEKEDEAAASVRHL
jgi:hypothetical protein